jgi:hypothetical protein
MRGALSAAARGISVIFGLFSTQEVSKGDYLERPQKSPLSFARQWAFYGQKERLLSRFTFFFCSDYFFSNTVRAMHVVLEFHRELTTARSHGTQVANVTKHF